MTQSWGSSFQALSLDQLKVDAKSAWGVLSPLNNIPDPIENYESKRFLSFEEVQTLNVTAS